MTQSKDSKKVTLDSLLEEFTETKTGKSLCCALTECHESNQRRSKVDASWYNFHLKDDNWLPELLDLAPALERAFLKCGNHRGFRILSPSIEAEYDLMDSPYLNNVELFDDKLNTVHTYHPDYTAHNAAVNTECELLPCVIDLLATGSGDATDLEHSEFNALLDFCCVDINYLCEDWMVVELTVPCLEDAYLVRDKFSNYIKSALSELDIFWSCQIWIGLDIDGRIWVDRIALQTVSK